MQIPKAERWKYGHLLGEEDDTLKGRASSISGEVVPIDGFPVVLERGTVEVEVLFLGNILGIAAGTCIRRGPGIESNGGTYRVQMGGWGLA